MDPLCFSQGPSVLFGLQRHASVRHGVRPCAASDHAHQPLPRLQRHRQLTQPQLLYSVEVLLQRQLRLEGIFRGELPPAGTHVHCRASKVSTLTPPSAAAGGEAHRGGQCAGTEGGPLHYAPEPVYPQHQGGLPAERHLRLSAPNQEATHVHVGGHADAQPAVSWPNICCYLCVCKSAAGDF